MKFESEYATVDCFEPIKPCRDSSISESKGMSSQMSPTVISLMAAGLAVAAMVFPFPGEELNEGSLDSMWDVALMVAFAVGAAAAKHFHSGKSDKASKKLSEETGKSAGTNRSSNHSKVPHHRANAAGSTTAAHASEKDSRSNDNSATAYNIHIDRHAKEGDIPGAERWLTQMVNAGVEPNTVTYNSLIHSCARAGDFAKAEVWLQRMMKTGVEMNAISYNAVLDACAKAGDAERSATTFDTMKDAGIQPTIVTYASLARPFARKGVWRKVEDIKGQLLEDGLAVNEHFLSIALSAYARARPKQPKRADRIFREAVEGGVVPNEFVLTSLESAVGTQAYTELLAELKIQPPQNGGKGGGKGSGGKGSGKSGSKGQGREERK
eukprot:gnl/MRDRNA2_/MRDRNA2_88861_c0_seq1.p1 gnl/MRDRNA2_/MRDRNA2_88861_c0~~gnl/MRDRNA2_/MRDRNA2_88861_c0_seq1.p1  ORF type:complete len:434 (+),score=80.67 gnl/MRDRNA2_/MRDRNA2_88861_c0_seq1:162-1304(+)